jgi:Tol biopolymer transport system component
MQRSISDTREAKGRPMKQTHRANRSAIVLATAALSAVILISLAGVRSVEAAFPGRNGVIAYDNEGDIFTINADGTNRRNLLPGPGGGTDAAWSSDGSKIAFMRHTNTPTTGDNQEIFTMNADGSGLRRLTTNSMWDTRPAWSPDGTKIAFMRYGAGRWDIWTMNSNGTGQTQLTNTPTSEYDPKWSPDGRTIAYERTAGLYLMNPDGTNQKPLSTTGVIGSAPDWSSIGTKLTFERSGEIYVINADGTGERRLTNDSVADLDPVFSPDGRYVVFQSVSRDGTNEYAGSRLRRVTFGGTTSPVDLTSPPAGVWHQNPNWQPGSPLFRVDGDTRVTMLYARLIGISGRFMDGASGISGRELTLWEQPAGSFKDFTQVPGATTTTDEDGSFSFQQLQPRQNTNYQVRFAGDEQAGLEPAMSPIKAVDVKVLVSLELSDTRLKRGEPVVISGEVEPSHEGEVTLTVRRDGKKVATKSAQLDESSRYSFTYEPARMGDHSVVASFPGDDDHAGNRSPKRSFTVAR